MFEKKRQSFEKSNLTETKFVSEFHYFIFFFIILEKPWNSPPSWKPFMADIFELTLVKAHPWLHIWMKWMDLHVGKCLACLYFSLLICVLELCFQVKASLVKKKKKIWCDLIERDYSVLVFPARHCLLFMCPLHWGLAPKGPWSQQLHLPLGQPSSPKGLYDLYLGWKKHKKERGRSHNGDSII